MSDDGNPYNKVGQAFNGDSGGYQGGNNSGNYQNRSGGNSYGNRNNGYSGGGGYNRQNGGGYNGGNFNKKPQGGGGFPKREYTEEDIRNAKFPMSVVFSGNDNLPEAPAVLMGRLIPAFEKAGFEIRSGGTNGMDEVVEKIAQKVDLHLPFRGFNKKESKSQFSNEICKEFARRAQPDIESLPKVQKAILEKNPRLLFGKYLTAPAQIVIVWSSDGCELNHEVTNRSGSAGHLVKLAIASGIPVINLQRPDAEQRALAILEKMNVQPQQQTQPQQHEQQHQSQQPVQGGNYHSGSQSGASTTGYSTGNQGSSGHYSTGTGGPGNSGYGNQGYGNSSSQSY